MATEQASGMQGQAHDPRSRLQARATTKRQRHAVDVPPDSDAGHAWWWRSLSVQDGISLRPAPALRGRAIGSAAPERPAPELQPGRG
jgi:hypothetical protein